MAFLRGKPNHPSQPPAKKRCLSRATQSVTTVHSSNRIAVLGNLHRQSRAPDCGWLAAKTRINQMHDPRGLRANHRRSAGLPKTRKNAIAISGNARIPGSSYEEGASLGMRILQPAEKPSGTKPTGLGTRTFLFDWFIGLSRRMSGRMIRRGEAGY